jgi:hypothetical protein
MNLGLLNEVRLGRTKSSKGWIRHPTITDESFLQELDEKFLKLAVKRKIPLEREALAAANKAGTWTDANQRDLDSSEAYLARLQESYEKIIEAQKKSILEALNEASIKVRNLRDKKDKAIGKTAEDRASKLSIERYILSLFYRDEKLLIRSWDDEGAEMLEQSAVDAAFKEFMLYRAKIGDDNLRELACSTFCQNLYAVSGNGFYFYGRSIVDLTCLQQRFLLLMENYKNIISNISGKVSSKTLSDWRELDKWAASSENGREQLEKDWGSPQGTGALSRESIMKASMLENPEASAKAVQKLVN